MDDEQDRAPRRLTRRTSRVSLVLAGVALTLGSSAAAASASTPKTPTSSAAVCEAGVSSDGRRVSGRCPVAPGHRFQFWVTACGPGSCQKLYGPWWPADYVWHYWTPGGYVSGFPTMNYD